MQVILSALLGLATLFPQGAPVTQYSLSAQVAQTTCIGAWDYLTYGGKITFITEPEKGGGWGPNKRVVIAQLWSYQPVLRPVLDENGNETGETYYVLEPILVMYGALEIGRDGRAVLCYNTTVYTARGFTIPFHARYEAWVAKFGDWDTALSPRVYGLLHSE